MVGGSDEDARPDLCIFTDFHGAMAKNPAKRVQGGTIPNHDPPFCACTQVNRFF
jgi:hypothetical protein